MTRRTVVALVVGGIWSVGCTQILGANWDVSLRDASPDMLISLSDARNDVSQGDAALADTGVDAGPAAVKCTFLEGGGGDQCGCFNAGDASIFYPPNDAACAVDALADPGACCASPGWPNGGACICQAFLCYADPLFGNVSCSYQPANMDSFALDGAVAARSATGTCCLSLGTDSGLTTTCDCYDAAASAPPCSGKSLTTCDMSTAPACIGSSVFGPQEKVRSCR